MIDVHCHILPGVDDGAPDMPVAVEMARVLTNAGFTRVAASPHFGEGPGGDVSLEDAAQTRQLLAAELVEQGLRLELLPNAEHHLTPELFARLENGRVAPLGGSGRWLLVEFPWAGVPDPEDVLFRLQTKGWRLLVAHPERHPFLDIDCLQRMVARDVKLQLSLGSFACFYGGQVAQKVQELADRRLGHVLATDLHLAEGAADWLAEAMGMVAERYGAQSLRKAAAENPESMVANAAATNISPFFSELQ